MRHIRDIDPQHTVIMVQVENETGSYQSPRDFSPAAQRLFAQADPGGARAQDRQDRHLDPGVRLEGRPGVQCLVHRALRRPGRGRRPGRARPADVRQCVAQRSVQGRRRAIWRERRSQLERDRHLEGGRAAPRARGAGHLRPRSEKVYSKQLDHYARPDNPLFVPENGDAPEYSRFLWLALGKGAVGWAPFGMDATGYSNFPLGAQKARRAKRSRPSRPNTRCSRRSRATGRGWRSSIRPSASPSPTTAPTRRKSSAAGRSPRNTANGSSANANGRGSPRRRTRTRIAPVGGAALIQLGPDEFLVAGSDIRIRFGLTRRTIAATTCSSSMSRKAHTRTAAG